MSNTPNTGLTPARVAALEYMAHNNGLNHRQVTQAVKRGEDPTNAAHGQMIAVSPNEMADLLRGYKERADG